MKRSVETRFITIVSATLLCVVVPLFTLFLALSSQQANSALRSQIELLLSTNAKALGKPVWDLDKDTVRQTVLGMVSDPAVRSIRVDDRLGKLKVIKTAATSARPVDLERISLPIIYKSLQGEVTVGDITAYVESPGWFAALHETEMAFIFIFALAVLTVFLAALVGNRLMVITPLMRLTAAIEATRKLGSRHHVDWQSTDEMGQLAESFNEMQTQLERDEQELKKAHQQATELYNRTPAMLFSLDQNDLIAAVSDYWLLATGYRRDEVVARPFVDFVAPADRAIFANRRSRRRPGGQSVEATVRFVCRSGDVIDVLIIERELDQRLGGTGSLNVMTDITELKRSEQRVRQQAITDHLTGLINRQGFEAILDQKLRDADETKDRLACLFVDLDRFKSVNDNLGHAAGDELLRQFVSRVLPLLREGDTASRLGGDEFAFLLTSGDVQESANELCKKIVALFENPFLVVGHPVRLSASVGVAIYPDHASGAADLLHKSDLAMYARKRDGKNGAQIFDPAILEKTRKRAEIEKDIDDAVTGGWFEAHFQPIVDLKAGPIIGFEALMRMRHPVKGMLLPAAIIEVAEENGTVGAIGNLILESAVANLARVSQEIGLMDAYVAVNLSPLQFECSLPTRLASLLGQYGIRPNRLVLEITEAVLMHDNPEVRRILNEIHSFGCRIALDDFGTGYSSLSYLSRFPVDIVKIDQSFIRSTEGGDEVGGKNRLLIEGITAISQKMNCKVIAEGVETAAQKDALHHMGVDCGQGYLFSKPLPIEDLHLLLGTSAARQSFAGTA
ncbi:diguanylate cyclase (GGDEF)-like protein/PAS domain S-box-containing protein [Pseudorhizobium tarimense]|uniref:Diguanylate cyclase (GGDEF)-like protein/PAS domain S-box-containing protein n=1 Tax=Pseudorhizobium tarimense TaxID=1079109 RepID=A0ABV2H7A0_9HYPH|nr:EAL domain-containing protein [Pseudorhizobium tarimense]MCJ8519352.1 EAL domain-containing protein [Pseudorhizobium tarimense]